MSAEDIVRCCGVLNGRGLRRCSAELVLLLWDEVITNLTLSLGLYRQSSMYANSCPQGPWHAMAVDKLSLVWD